VSAWGRRLATLAKQERDISRSAVVAEARASRSLLVVFQNIQREAVMQLHAGRTQNGAQRARRSALFPDDLANVLVGDAESYHRGIVVIEHLDGDILGLINQRLDYLQDKSFHPLSWLGGS